MTLFIRCLSATDKQQSLLSAALSYRKDEESIYLYSADPTQFRCIPGAPFVYWVADSVRQIFSRHPKFETTNRTAKQGIATADDFRFLRAWWETSDHSEKWKSFAKGGGFSPFYADLDLVVNWEDDGSEIKNFRDENGKIRSRPQNLDYCLRQGITWSLRPSKDGSFRAMPENTVFSIMGSAAFVDEDQDSELMCLLAICNTKAFNFLIGLLSSRGGEGSNQTKTYDVGCLSNTPIPLVPGNIKSELTDLAFRAYETQRRLCSNDELDHGFLVPELLAARLNGAVNFEEEFQETVTKINNIVNSLYGIRDSDLSTIEFESEPGEVESDDFADLDEDGKDPGDPQNNLVSWAVGVAFGRFDWRLATGERDAPLVPGPFEPLPTKSPGMLPNGAAPFHRHMGVLVDDSANPHDLARLVEEVMVRVDAHVPQDVRRWLQRDFFPFHLQRYSQSRRKAPIYWPLSTSSGDYTLWVYCPSLTSQTLYTAINDFIEPKLKQVGGDVTELRNKGSARTREDERALEALQAFELELIELRDTLLKLVPSYKPHQDDGVQISAAPLWPLFRHKPWQKALKDTWAKLEKGDYDWAHLAMNYWPDRVREKCKTDKSLAIAHGLEHLYVEPEAPPKKTRGRKKTGGDE
jgi:hypothetical protein